MADVWPLADLQIQRLRDRLSALETRRNAARAAVAEATALDQRLFAAATTAETVARRQRGALAPLVWAICERQRSHAHTDRLAELTVDLGTQRRTVQHARHLHRQAVRATRNVEAQRIDTPATVPTAAEAPPARPHGRASGSRDLAGPAAARSSAVTDGRQSLDLERLGTGADLLCRQRRYTDPSGASLWTTEDAAAPAGVPRYYPDEIVLSRRSSSPPPPNATSPLRPAGGGSVSSAAAAAAVIPFPPLAAVNNASPTPNLDLGGEETEAWSPGRSFAAPPSPDFQSDERAEPRHHVNFGIAGSLRPSASPGRTLSATCALSVADLLLYVWVRNQRYATQALAELLHDLVEDPALDAKHLDSLAHAIARHTIQRGPPQRQQVAVVPPSSSTLRPTLVALDKLEEEARFTERQRSEDEKSHREAVAAALSAWDTSDDDDDASIERFLSGRAPRLASKGQPSVLGVHGRLDHRAIAGL
jgi:hypothetical protein